MDLGWRVRANQVWGEETTGAGHENESNSIVKENETNNCIEDHGLDSAYLHELWRGGRVARAARL